MTIDEKRNDKGELVAWKIRVCVGRENNKQKWKTLTVRTDDPRIISITGRNKDKNRLDEVNRIGKDFEKEQKKEFANQLEQKGMDPDAVILDKRKITIQQYIRLLWWKDLLANSPRPNTISFYKYTTDNICSYFDTLPKAKQKLYSMEPRTAKDFVNYLKTNAVGKDGEKISETTILRHWQTFRTIIKSALCDEYIERDPCLNFKITDKPKTPKYDGDFLSKEQARTLISLLDHLDDGKTGELENENLHWKCLINLLLQHGLRRGEAVGLRWEDIKTETIDGKKYYTIDIKQNVTPDKSDENKIHIGNPKTKNSTRTILIQPEVYKMLMELKTLREKKSNVVLMPSSYVFCKYMNNTESKQSADTEKKEEIKRPIDPAQPMYPTAPTRWLARFIQNHEELPNVSPHDLRRTWATLANEAGVNQKAIQHNLGHSDESDVDSRHYIKLTQAVQIDALETMHGVFYGEEPKSEINNATQSEA